MEIVMTIGKVFFNRIWTCWSICSLQTSNYGDGRLYRINESLMWFFFFDFAIITYPIMKEKIF